jgi:molybdopterin synthase sulfur carrier subunit
MQILFFGQLVDITGSSTLTMPDVPDTDALVQQLHQLYPALATIKYVIAVDKKKTSENVSLQSHTTIALLPPFSGG